MNGHAQTVEFHIQVTFPPNADMEDYENVLDEIIGYTSDHTGLGVDGWVGKVMDGD